MRTTLTIDDHIAHELKQEVRRTGASFKETLNSVISDGLAARRKPTKPKPFVITPFPMGLGLIRKTDKVSEMLEELEGPYHR